MKGGSTYLCFWNVIDWYVELETPRRLWASLGALPLVIDQAIERPWLASSTCNHSNYLHPPTYVYVWLSGVKSGAQLGGVAATGKVEAMARSAVCIGDAELFASEMIKTINAKEYRLATRDGAARCTVSLASDATCYAVSSGSDFSFVVGEEKKIIYAHKCILAARSATVTSKNNEVFLYFSFLAFRGLQVRSVSSNVRCSAIGRSQRSAGALWH